MKQIGIKFSPFYLYPLTVLIILLLYSFGFSNIYPEISLPSYIFLILTVIISILVGNLFEKKYVINKSVKHNKLNLKLITLI